MGVLIGDFHNHSLVRASLPASSSLAFFLSHGLRTRPWLGTLEIEIEPRLGLLALWSELNPVSPLDSEALKSLDDVSGLFGQEKINEFAGTGVDEELHRGESAYDRYYGDPRVTPNPCLGPVAKAPFYAVRVDPGERPHVVFLFMEFLLLLRDSTSVLFE